MIWALTWLAWLTVTTIFPRRWQRYRRHQVRGKPLVLIAVAQIPVGGIDADGVHADEHLARFRLRYRHRLVAQYVGTAEFVQSDGLHGGHRRDPRVSSSQSNIR